MYVLAGIRCRVWAQKSVCSNRGYVISKYILTDILYGKVAGPRRSVRCNRGNVISESVITKFYCSF